MSTSSTTTSAKPTESWSAPGLPREYTGTTRLEDCITDLPWRRSIYDIGYGLNAVTGRLTKTRALKDFTLSRNEASVEEQLSFSVIHDANSLKRELGVSARASLNMAPLDLSVNVLGSLKSSCSVSATSVSMVVIYRSETQDDDTGIKYELTDEAAAVAKNSVDAFREKYGDYFIVGSRWGSLFVAVVTCKCIDNEKRKAIAVALESTASRAFTSSVAAEIDKELSSLKAEVCISMRTFGLARDAYASGDAPPAYRSSQSFVDILTQLEWFKRHKLATGDRICAVLRHYSVVQGLEDVIKNTLPIGRDVFEAVEKLRDTVFSCQLLARGLPVYPSKDAIVPELQRRVHTLEDDVYQAQLHVVDDETCRKALLAAALKLEADLEAFQHVYSVFHRLLRECKRQPGPHHNARGDSYGYGLNLEHSHPDCCIEVGETTEIIVRSRFLGPNFAIGELKRPKDGHIVGWRVQAKDPKHSSWRQHTASVILAPEGQISCKRKPVWRNFFRPCKWQFTIFVVRGNPSMDLFYNQIDYEDKGSMTTLKTEPTTVPM